MAPSSMTKPSKMSTKVAKKKVPLTKKATKKSSSTPRTKNSPQNILQTINGFHAIGMNVVKRALLVRYLGYSNPRSFTNMLAKYKKEGLVTYPDGDTVQLTDAGKQQAGDVLVEPSNEAAQDLIRKQLKGKSLEVFNVLCDGNVYSREELKEKTNSTHMGRSFGNGFGPLSALEIVEYPKDETSQNRKLVRLNDSAFPVGHPYS